MHTIRSGFNTTRSVAAHLFAIASLLGLGACTQDMTGVYQDELGTIVYDFRNEQRVYITVLEVTVAGGYTADGDRIIVTGPQGTVVLAREDNHLIGPVGQVLLRQPSSSRVAPNT